MKNITNNFLKKELKKYNLALISTIILFITSLSFIGIYFLEENKNHQNSIYLNSIIKDMDNKPGLNANLKVAQIPYSFAKYSDDPNNAYYIIYDGDYFYIAYMSDSQFKKLNNENIKNNPITIYGKTKYTTEDVRILALETYNDGLDTDKQITSDDFLNYFGGVYLDVANNKDNYILFLTLGLTLLFTSLITLIISIISKIKSNKLLKNIDVKELKKIDKELNEKEAIYYKKCHVILAKNYLITFIGSVQKINYKDIIWAYEGEIKPKGFTIVRTIIIKTNTNNDINIAEITGMSEKNIKTINEILTALSTKNKNILIGKTTENKKKVKEIIKNIK